ncbi:CoA pyrophosphatase [Pseudodonghicola xiamenensis]|uniref:Coenzyme A pyrophosphatase n=1 Tax=Pseudodonghicola xiamenensis TaxID=337702 RepID=A0A8J3MB30_9RHOB|nr:CoA pyrophosphatase [Pseudodonghicola xiamenensis]GHG82865.1 coenzyme A pyrophosphatase [Pseudodonghicola xiamenensis]
MLDLTRDPVSQLRLALERPGQASSDFDLNPEFRLPGGRKLRPAAVLITVTLATGVPQVVLTKRSSALKNHPGQIAFPGGKREEYDADAAANALREAEEEIGLPHAMPRILGSLPTHETVTGFEVTPVLAVLDQPFTPVADPSEVAEVFEVPLSHLMQPDNYLIEARIWRGMRRHYFTVPYGPYYIWGATARMLRQLAVRLEA